MKRKKFNLLVYYIILMSLFIGIFGTFYWFYNSSVHNKFMKDTLQDYKVYKAPVDRMGSSLAYIMAGGLVLLSIFLTIIIAEAQKILNNESLNLRRETFLQTVKSLANSIEARDPYTRGHSTHVAGLLLLFYQYLPSNYKKDIDIILLEYAGLLHDIGKIGIPEVILSKPGSLTDEEFLIMKKHPEIGKAILEPVEDFSNIRQWILFHHERIDGHGYPSGLQGRNIPLISRLLAIVDTYSALVTDRPYRIGKSHNDAVKIMDDVSGKQLDRELLDYFFLIREEQLEVIKPSLIQKILVQ